MAAAKSLGGSLWVVKAQVHAGGRGKAGGVKVAKDLRGGSRRCHRPCWAPPWSRIRPARKDCRCIRCTWKLGSKIAREIYLSLVLNRDVGRLAFVASAAGGMDIEEVARALARRRSSASRFIRRQGCRTFSAASWLSVWGSSGAQIAQFGKIAHAIYKLYLERDASLVEVNPLIVTADGESAGAGCQDQHRRQRAVSTAGSGRDAR